MATKVCTRCGVEKDIEQFALRNRLTHLRQSHCTTCGGEMRDDWYARNREDQVKAGMKRRDEYKQVLREYVWNYLTTHPCINCGETDPAALEFHHVRGVKAKEVSVILKNGASLQTLIAEIEKCDILCASCHRKLTAKEKGWYKNWSKGNGA
jgi:hypothetical protein